MAFVIQSVGNGGEVVLAGRPLSRAQNDLGSLREEEFKCVNWPINVMLFVTARHSPYSVLLRRRGARCEGRSLRRGVASCKEASLAYRSRQGRHQKLAGDIIGQRHNAYRPRPVAARRGGGRTRRWLAGRGPPGCQPDVRCYRIAFRLRDAGFRTIPKLTVGLLCGLCSMILVHPCHSTISRR